MISTANIESLGFTNLRTQEPRRYSIVEFYRHPLRYLHSLDLLHFKFVTFEDQIIDCDFRGAPWKIFGEQRENIFAIEEKSGRVFCVTRTFEGEPDLLICAETIEDFASLFNMFVSYVFRVRASFKSGHDKFEENIADYFLSYARQFLDEEQLQASYWARECELIELGETKLTCGMIELLATDRLLYESGDWPEKPNGAS